MLPTDTYLSIAGLSTGIYREKSSKFLAFAYPVSQEVEIKELLDNLRKEFHDANHFCYAYKIGHEKPAYRFNDDGEPSGSAGKPIYGQILSSGLSDILIVVIRYFGGKKLGIPGLINAYRTAAKEALDVAQVTTKTIVIQYSIRFPYNTMNDVMKILKDEEAKISIQVSEDQCDIEFWVRKSTSESVRKRLERVSGLAITMSE